ncbi:MAG TPA: hypothetical protein DCX53_07045, partial [Anaerolineae bacterium]|nr:hypothetical protein [Anaerolineae bacterium]
MNKRPLWFSVLAVATLLLTTAFASLTNGPDNVTLTVLDSFGSPLNGVKVYYNDYGTHWVLLGTTTGGNPVLATFPNDGTYNIKAVKDNSEQSASVVVSGTGSNTFQTSLFT